MKGDEKLMGQSDRDLLSEEDRIDALLDDAPTAEQTLNELLRNATESYLAGLDPDDTPSPSTIEAGLLQEVRNRIVARNATVDKTDRWRMPKRLEPVQVATIMAHMHHICRIATSGANISPDYDVLAIYMPDGYDAGTYVTSEDDFRRIARSYDYTMTSKEFQEVMIALRDLVPRLARCADPDLIAVNNGIFDYATKTLMPFDPEKVFLVKSHVDYDENATNPIIHNDKDNTDWDVVSWMNELSDDPEIVHVLWQILGAIIRPNVRWNKSAWLYSEKGNNGKGTLCELMRNLCGPGAYASIPLSDFSSDFMLEPLTHASAIIVDENDVGTYVDRAANLKAVITNDVITINRKFKSPIAYQFFGFMVQCLNEFPQIRDRSDSFYRRQLFIPFEKCFTGHERRYIKGDYLRRPEVLRYVLKTVLNMDYYELDEPQQCKDILSEYMEYNDPLRQFWNDISDKLVWDLVPFKFLHALYKAWLSQNVPGGKPLGRNKFISELVALVNQSDTWYCSNKNAKIRPANRMDATETLIIQYDLVDWMSNTKSPDPAKRCAFDLEDNYTGIQRYHSLPAANDDAPDDDASDDA